jgi:hypothetical protein
MPVKVGDSVVRLATILRPACTGLAASRFLATSLTAFTALFLRGVFRAAGLAASTSSIKARRSKDRSRKVRGLNDCPGMQSHGGAAAERMSTFLRRFSDELGRHAFRFYDGENHLFSPPETIARMQGLRVYGFTNRSRCRTSRRWVFNYPRSIARRFGR